MPTRRYTILGLLFGMAAGVSGGCTAPRPPRIVSDPDPAVKIPAIKIAAESRNAGSIPHLVRGLENDDPAVRLYSIGALRRLTNQDFGYVYFHDDERRRPATLKWQAWLRDRESGTARGTAPDTAPDTAQTMPGIPPGTPPGTAADAGLKIRAGAGPAAMPTTKEGGAVDGRSNP